MRRWVITGDESKAGRGRRAAFVFLVLILAADRSLLVAQIAGSASSNDDSLRQHYSAAENAQAASNLDQAEMEYKAFLAEILHRLADRRAQAGDFDKATEFFGQALPLAPHDNGLHLDYAEARRSAGNLDDAQAAATFVLKTDPQNARAHFVLGRILLRRNEDERATDHLEIAVTREPTFEHGYLLGIAYLKRKSPDRATAVFVEMLAGLGDTPAIHMEFGRAYAEAGYPEQGIEEFKKTLAKDDKFPGAHYSLGAAYLVGLADAAFPEAAEEFRKELKNRPDDVLSLYQLGYIAVSQHQLKEAEEYLGRAAALDPANPDVYLSLGQVYAETERRPEAEANLRKSIDLTKEVSHNHYQVQRAHYLLGRLLLQTGHPEEAKQELQIADRLLKQSVASNQGQAHPGQADAGSPDARPAQSRLSGEDGTNAQMRATQKAPNPETVKQMEAYEKQVGPAIADSYNNLGAILATNDRFSEALTFFQLAAAWNPSLEGIEYNWGKAALAAEQYDQAIAPLTRHLQSHPEDAAMRAALGSCLFKLKRYGESVAILKPMEIEINANPQLDYVYSVSLVKSGAIAAGMTRLQSMASVMPRLFDVHVALADAYSLQGDHQNAARELGIAVKLNPSDVDAQRKLASESAIH